MHVRYHATYLMQTQEPMHVHPGENGPLSPHTPAYRAGAS
jgi:hypothetical protein